MKMVNSGTSIISAVPTRYAGCTFRSRLEARWVVFFNHLGIRWEYEPEGVATSHGAYLPDFLLHLKKPTLFEVKPITAMGDESDYERWAEAADLFGLRMVVAYGLPAADQLDPGKQPGGGQIQLVGWDEFYAFCFCPWCNAVGIEFDGRGERACGYQFHPEDKGDECMPNPTHPRIAAAYDAARSAKFDRSTA